jgi:osmotically-inducible protein OsmY
MNEHAGRKLEQAIASDLRTNELGITVTVTGEQLTLRGEVASRARRDAVISVVHEHLPEAEVTDELVISADETDPPAESELITDHERTPDDA